MTLFYADRSGKPLSWVKVGNYYCMECKSQEHMNKWVRVPIRSRGEGGGLVGACVRRLTLARCSVQPGRPPPGRTPLPSSCTSCNHTCRFSRLRTDLAVSRFYFRNARYFDFSSLWGNTIALILFIQILELFSRFLIHHTFFFKYRVNIKNIWTIILCCQSIQNA